MYKFYDKVSAMQDAKESKGKLFRPWDASEDQDSTISTTTSESEEVKVGCDDESDRGFRTPTKKTSYAHSLNEYNSMFPDCYPALAQTLGIPGNDPFLLESLSHGYAIEEYARVISEEHQAKMLSARKQRPKKYKCPHCDVGFSNNGQLKGHIRIHTGERPFKCEEENCGKTFTRNEELTRHKRIHSGLRPFPCPQCGKRFGRKDHLKKHSRTHMQPRGLYAVPVMLPLDTWTAAAAASAAVYPYVPMFGY